MFLSDIWSRLDNLRHEFSSGKTEKTNLKFRAQTKSLLSSLFQEPPIFQSFILVQKAEDYAHIFFQEKSFNICT